MSTCGTSTCFSLSGDANGALVQLAANSSGAAGRYLTCNPQVTYFRQEYCRHSNFAKGEADMAFCTQADWGRALIGKWQRNGDGAREVYVQLCVGALSLVAGSTNQLAGHPNFGNIMDPAKTVITWVNAVGHAAIDTVELVIGGSNIDKIHGEMLHIWAQAAYSDEHKLRELIGEFDNLDDARDFAAKQRLLIIPIPFYFSHSKYPENLLQVIALQNHDIVTTVCLRARNSLIKAFDPANGVGLDYTIPASAIAGGALSDARLTVNWIYLDVCERTMMAQCAHEVLIVQHQRNCDLCVTASVTQACVCVQLNHPVIEYFWVFQETRKESTNDWFDFSIDEDPAIVAATFPWSSANNPPPPLDPFASIELAVNGHSRIAQRSAVYFRTVTFRESHTRVPTRFIYGYSFALCPEDVSKPSGHQNHSRIDNIQAKFTFSRTLPFPGCIRFYARNNNVIKICGGMLALRFAN